MILTMYIQTMEDEAFLSSRVLARLERADESKAEPKGATANVDLKSSLAVKIPVFHGDRNFMKWSEFWELFLVSIHENSSFADVHKFVVLKSHLAGPALQAVKGIPVSGKGYTKAV